MDTGTMCLIVAALLAMLLFGSRVVSALQSFGKLLMRWALGVACIVGAACWWQSSGPSKESGSTGNATPTPDASFPSTFDLRTSDPTGYGVGAGLPQPGVFNPYAAGALDSSPGDQPSEQQHSPTTPKPAVQRSPWAWWAEE